MRRETVHARVLVVDGEPLKRANLAAEFEAAGHTVTSRPSADAAIEDVMNDGFDVVVTDLMMPGMDGLTFLARIKQLHPDTVVIVMTARRNTSIVNKAIMRAGAQDCIIKPFSNERLVLKAEDILSDLGKMRSTHGGKNGNMTTQMAESVQA